MEQKHTPEPWFVEAGGNSNFKRSVTARTSRGMPKNVALISTHPLGSPEANAARIVACVNACAGLDDPQAAIELMKADHLRALKAEAQRDELLAALRFYADPRRYHGPNQRAEPGDESESPYFVDVTRDGGQRARAILAKHGA